MLVPLASSRSILVVPFGLGVWEIVILLVVLALLFGAKVPEVAKRLGTGVREVRDAVADVDPRRMLEPGDEPPKKPPETDRREGEA